MGRGLLSWRGALAGLLLVVAGCSPYPSASTETRPAATQSTRPKGTPANTMKEPGHIPGG